ncbi:MAG: OmpA family protein [Planctomycetota bacterium]
MDEHDPRPETPDTAQPDLPVAAETLDELRQLLVGPERQELDRLKQQLAANPHQAAQVAELLPRAVTLRTEQDDQLARALAPTVESAIQTSVRDNPQPMIDAVFPIIGPAIRKAVADAFATAVQSLNQTLEHSFSVRSLRWRIEAARTGKPFAEVVLLHTLRYRVEQVLLIQPESGLLMQQVAAPGVQLRDGQLVSGMLTAITEFVRDSFAPRSAEDAGDPPASARPPDSDPGHLRTLQVGGVTLWIEPGPHAVLVAAVRGSAPVELRQLFQRALEDLHRQHAPALTAFAGDADGLSATQPELERCLVSAAQPGTKRKVSPPLILGGLLLLAVFFTAVFWAARANLRWSNYLSDLKTAPGIMLVEADHRWLGRSSVRGLYDPAVATDPHLYLEHSSIDPAGVRQRWEPYPTASAPVFTLPEPAPAPTIEPATPVPAVPEAEASPSPPAPTAQEQAEARLETLAGRIAEAVVRMPRGNILELDGQREIYDDLVRDLAAARDLSGQLGNQLVLVVTGHTDAVGDPDTNLELSEARAAAVADDLQSRLTPPIRFILRGVGSAEPIVGIDASRAAQIQNRRVTFRVELRPLDE